MESADSNMERLRAFEPKDITALANSDSEESRGVDEKNRLGELSKDEATVKSFEFYFDRIRTGRIGNTEELKARMEQRYSRQNGYLLKEDGSGILNSFTEVRQGERFEIKDQEQAELLIGLFEENNAAREGRREAEQNIQAFKFYSDRILSNQIGNTEELKARLAQRVDSGGFLLKENGRNILDSLVQVERNERFEIKDQEQAELLADVYKLLNDEGISDEVKSPIRKYFQSGDVTDLERVRGLVATYFESISDRVDGVIDRYDSTKKRLDFKQKFYKELFENESVDIPLRTLADFDEQDVEDTNLVADLRRKALGERRLRTAQEFASSVAAPDRDFDQTLAEIDVLERSSSQRDLACARVLRKSLYRLELATQKDETRQKFTLDADPMEISQFVDGLPVRPSAGDFDYIDTQSGLKQGIADSYVVIGRVNRFKKANELRRDFGNPDIDGVLSKINDFPDETEEDMVVKMQLLDLYKNYLAANNTEMFDEMFKKQIEEGMEAKLKQKFISPELGRNKEAFRYLKENFDEVIDPLVETYRDDPRTKKEVSQILDPEVGKVTPDNPRLKYYQIISELEKQRPLTDTERAYIQSVGLLTLFNPYLVAAATADFGVTNEYLRHHFEVKSKETQESLNDGDYIPLIQVGTGPNGLAAFGEVVRNNPELARQALLIDKGNQPGGPFDIPRGPAWELNSANRRGLGGYGMPDINSRDELKTVRSYGSPVARWYPGERSKGSSIRQGSINATVDYLSTPDDLSNARYPTNEELQAILALQTALLTKKLALRTELLKVEPNPIQDENGDKIATLKITDKDGTDRIIKLKTDGVFIGTGLGDPTYGFPLEGSNAERVIEETKESGSFPKITTTLEAFKAFSDRSKEKKSPGRTLAVWGRGNSADTLIEFVGNIFQGDNPLVRDVGKIYIVSEGDLSARPRYSLISDLKPRNGRGNLIEQVNARVADVDFFANDGDPAKRQIALIDRDGNAITDNEGRVIRADSGIAATGFRPQLDKIFEAYLDGGSLRDEGENAPLQPVKLPTNPEVPVAESFRADPNIILLGTASRPRFNSLEKLAQLPVEAREALLRNGAENAVAIGFRAPDTQAAVNIWLNSRNTNLEPRERKSKLQISLDGDKGVDTEVEIERTVDSENLAIPNDVDQEDLLLSPLLAQNLSNQFKLERSFSGNADFGLQYDKESGKFKLKFDGGDIESVSPEFVDALRKGVSDEYFQRYALSLLGKRRRDPKLDVNVAFRKGKVNPRGTFVQVT